MLNVERKNVERKTVEENTSKGKVSKSKMSKMKNAERRKCRINRKSCLMLIMKYLLDFNEKKKNTFITNRPGQM
jgi:hypothetical protein